MVNAGSCPKNTTFPFNIEVPSAIIPGKTVAVTFSGKLPEDVPAVSERALVQIAFTNVASEPITIPFSKDLCTVDGIKCLILIGTTFSIVENIPVPTTKLPTDSLRKHGLFKGYKSAILTIFLEPNPTSSSIATILCEPDYKSYWKKRFLINTSDILNYFQEKILPGNEFAETAIQEIIEGLEFKFPANKYKSEKKLIIFPKADYIVMKFMCLIKWYKMIIFLFQPKNTCNIVCYTFRINICEGQSFEDVVI
ncbi:hypothetical protein Glove_70g61 [Diversispora epigaea]|uniref:Uncharacterized protein n=1 Tax=Diversispora epigaea TaxID=1348612 RepID=A0A397JA22_9GLOM|nr:hypothetical protein Glove_70g61 [Diversispora epigaea]